jgi:peptide/nickel transport system ATP-binding protein
MNLLEVAGLRIHYPEGATPAVADLSFSLDAGEALGIVGESGSGKTQTALAVMGLLPADARLQGSVRFDGCELLGKDNKLLNRFRARRIAMVFQDPNQALNPYLGIGDQLRRVLLAHRVVTRNRVRPAALGLLERVGLPDPERQLRAYPHQLSGGMRQRALIALALAAEPDVLIADEPTTALDVTVQAQILNLLRKLRAEAGIALLLITHDLGVIARNSERVLVMHRGRAVEHGATAEVFRNPSHPRTREMLDAAPGLARAVTNPTPAAGGAAPLLRVDDVSVSFRVANGARRRRRSMLHAVRSVSLTVASGETVAIVGESGSGKTTLARAIVGLLPANEGDISFRGVPLAGRVQERPAAVRRQLQMVFQDPAASLDPAMTVADIVAEPLGLQHPGLVRAERGRRVGDVLQRVGLPGDLLKRRPHELSGGQAQRVAIARALVLEPQLLICDEAVAALDGTIRKEVLDLLRAEQHRSGLALVFITHDLALVRRISHRVLVMYMGRVFELADSKALFERPRHPYTRALLDAIPVATPDAPPPVTRIRGEVASLLHPPAGCVFHPRCEFRIARCGIEVPALQAQAGGAVACHRAGDIDLR